MFQTPKPRETKLSHYCKSQNTIDFPNSIERFLRQTNRMSYTPETEAVHVGPTGCAAVCSDLSFPQRQWSKIHFPPLYCFRCFTFAYKFPQLEHWRFPLSFLAGGASGGYVFFTPPGMKESTCMGCGTLIIDGTIPGNIARHCGRRKEQGKSEIPDP